MAKEIPFFSNINLRSNETLEKVLEKLPSNPSNPKEGRIYYNTNLKKAKFYNGNEWISFPNDEVHTEGNNYDLDLNGAKVIEKITTDENGHINQLETRLITLSDVGFDGDANANNYTHPTFNVEGTNDFGEGKFISEINVNGEGHVTGIVVKEISISDLGGAQINDDTQNDYQTWSSEKIYNIFSELQPNTSNFFKYMGDYDANNNTPDLDNITLGKGYSYSIVGGASTFYGTEVKNGDLIISNTENPESLTDWLIISGKPLDVEDGRDVEMGIIGNVISWRNVGDEDWQSLYTLEDVRGPQGDPFVYSDFTEEQLEDLRQKSNYFKNPQNDSYFDSLSSLTTESDSYDESFLKGKYADVVDGNGNKIRYHRISGEWVQNSLDGIVFESDQVNQKLIIKNSEGEVLSEISVAFLNNEGTKFSYNSNTNKLELSNDENEILSEIPISSFVSNLANSLEINGNKLILQDTENNELDFVEFGIDNIENLQKNVNNIFFDSYIYKSFNNYEDISLSNNYSLIKIENDNEYYFAKKISDNTPNLRNVKIFDINENENIISKPNDVLEFSGEKYELFVINNIGQTLTVDETYRFKYWRLYSLFEYKNKITKLQDTPMFNHSMSSEVEGLNGSIVYYSNNEYKYFYFSNYSSFPVYKGVTVEREGDKLIIIYQSISEPNYENYIMVFHGCYFYEGELFFSHFQESELPVTHDPPEGFFPHLHGVEVNQGNIYIATRPNNQTNSTNYATEVIRVNLENTDDQSKLSMDVNDYYGNSTDLIVYKENLYFFMKMRGGTNNTKLLKVDKGLNSTKELFTYENLGGGRNTHFDTPYQIVFDKIVTFYYIEGNDEKNKLGVVKLNFDGTVFQEKYHQITTDYTGEDGFSPHWMTYFNGKIILQTASGSDEEGNWRLIRFDYETLDLEESIELTEKATDDNYIHKDGWVYLLGEGEAPSHLKKYYYSDFSQNSVEITDYSGSSSPKNYIPRERNKTKLSEFENDVTKNVFINQNVTLSKKIHNNQNLVIENSGVVINIDQNTGFDECYGWVQEGCDVTFSGSNVTIHTFTGLTRLEGQPFTLVKENENIFRLF